MAYDKFKDSKPDIADDGVVVVDDTRINVEALRDAIVAGVMPDWDLNEVNGPDPAAPTELIWKNGVRWLRAQITWGSAGGSDGSPLVCVYAFNGNNGAGGNWDTIATLTMSYDAAGYVDGSIWS